MVERNIRTAEQDARTAGYLPRLIGAVRSQEEALADKRTPTTTELIAGWEFRGGFWETDAIAWAREWVQADGNIGNVGVKLPKAVAKCLDELQKLPVRMSVITLRRAALKRKPEWAHTYISTLDRIERRCTVYLSHLGDIEAQAWVAAEALRQLHGRQFSPMTAELLAAGIAGTTGIKPRELAHHCRTFIQHFEATGMAETSDGLQAWLDEYVASNMARDARHAALEQAITDDDDLMPEAPGSTQHRIVVPTFSKTPKADNPKAEFLPIAGKPLPLNRFEGDLAKVSASLCARWPWATASIKAYLMDLVGQPFMRFRPTIFLGPPGTGKSALTLEIARSVGLVPTLYSAAGNADGSFGGTSAQWSTARGSVSAQALLRAFAANCLVIVDELEKAGLSRHNGNMHDVLVTAVEPVTARCMLDPCLEMPVDLSGISYLATANSLDGISAPLRDRFRILSVPAPGPEHLPVIAGQILHSIRVERGTTDDWLTDLDGEEMAILAEHWQGGSMRTVRRMIETILAGREIYATHH